VQNLLCATPIKKLVVLMFSTPTKTKHSIVCMHNFLATVLNWQLFELAAE
jgi:hypothetical protein